MSFLFAPCFLNEFGEFVLPAQLEPSVTLGWVGVVSELPWSLIYLMGDEI